MDFRRVTPLWSDKSVFSRIIAFCLCIVLAFTSLFVYDITFEAMTVQSEAVADGEEANVAQSNTFMEKTDNAEPLVLNNAVGLLFSNILRDSDILSEMFDSSVNTNETNGQEENGEVTVVMYKNSVETASVPYETRKVSYDTSKGQTAGRNVTGKDGVSEILRRQKYVNGQMVEDAVVSENVVQQPVTAVEYVNVTPVAAKAVSKAVEIPAADAPTAYSRALRVKFTAYTYNEDGGTYTSTGKSTRVGYVAVDPKVIPYHSLLYCVTDDGYVYGYCYAEDCGGAIKGNKIDLFLPTLSACYSFGVRMGTCYVVTEG